MIKVSDIFKVLEDMAPCRLAKSYDNVGFIVGKASDEVKKVIVALDITGAVIEEAIKSGANLIVSHHPIIFGSRSRITDEDATGSLLLKLIENRISAICMHTNLDSAAGGVNDVLAKVLGINIEGIVEPDPEGLSGGGRYGSIEKEIAIKDFLPLVCKALSTDGVRYHDAGLLVKEIAVGGGSCGDYIVIAKKLGCDTVVTADVKHNQFLEAAELGINVIDAGHFATEDVVCPRICEIVSASYPDLPVKKAEADKTCTEFFVL